MRKDYLKYLYIIIICIIIYYVIYYNYKKNTKDTKNVITQINYINDINENIDSNDISNYISKYPSFNLDYYKQFNNYSNAMNDTKLKYHFVKYGNDFNRKYNSGDFTINNYVKRLDESHLLFNDIYGGYHFKNISTFDELKLAYYTNYKPYYIYNEESFYLLYPDFDVEYYRNKYFNNIDISEFELLKHYHTIGIYQRYTTNNRIKIIIYCRPFDILCGGVVALHNLAKVINDLKHPRYYAKLFIYNNIKYTNIFCNDFAYIEEINDNTIVVYPEIVSGNPLNCKTVIRWILLNLGVEMPLNHYLNWNIKSPDSQMSSDGIYNFVYNWESKNNKPKLCLPWFNPIFTFKNKRKTKTCYLIKKGSIIHKNIKYFHKSDSICIDKMNIQEICDIFNESTHFYCYDPYTAFTIFAVSCGCVSVIYPLENVSKNDYFKNTILNKNNFISNAGYAYGIDDIQNAENTVDFGINMYKKLFDDYKYTVVSLFSDINKIIN